MIIIYIFGGKLKSRFIYSFYNKKNNNYNNLVFNQYSRFFLIIVLVSPNYLKSTIWVERYYFLPPNV